ncbi:MAG TPA: benzoate-CoA ligase family protein [Blastocatellia bacterium]|nr:benzoate-CoA ligase family protein [Blastocatellia bacterium]
MFMVRSLFSQLFPPERASRGAILYEHSEIAYSELCDETIRVAEVLNGLDIQAGDRVAILLADSPEFIASFVAIISLGAIAVPINLALRREDQLFILEDCGARAAIIEASSMQALIGEADAPPELHDILIVRREGDSQISSVRGMNVQDFVSAKGVSEAPHAEAAIDSDAFILYTSGSTGEPKGAVHSQADIFYTNETYCREVLRLREGDRLFSSSRLPFAYGLGNAFTFPLLNGFTTILCREKPAPAVVSEVFNLYRPTIFFGVPVVYRMLLEHHRSVAPLDTSSLRLCVSAGEALPAQLGEEWEKTFGVQVLDGIGSTEMLHMFMSNHDGEVRYGSSGQLLNGYDARLVDHEGAATEPGEVGNLWIRGASASSRYWQRLETTTQTFVDGWTRTGDLYRCDENGFWWHMGRSDDCFKPTGQWVSPIEVESVMVRHDAVRVAAVVEGFDKDGLSCVCAFLVLTDGHDPESAEIDIRALCEAALPRFKQPRRYYFVSELPYTATGKVQRFKLREQLRGEKGEQQL